MITRPMLAETLKNKEDIKFPVSASPKFDGIRCLIVNKPVSRKFKEIPNKYIYSKLSELPNGLDGELIIPGKTFNEIQSIVMSEDGNSEFEYHIFDYVKNDLNEQYNIRIENLKSLKLPDFCKLVLPKSINNIKELDLYEELMLKNGYEGVMIRNHSSPYKCGRSTVKEGFLLKIKRFNDSEAKILEFHEKLQNNNEIEKNELGYTKRSSKKANLKPVNTLGAILVKDVETGIEFSIGTGFNDELKQEIWDNKEKYLNKTITYTFQNVGAKNKPRFPSFKGFRDEKD